MLKNKPALKPKSSKSKLPPSHIHQQQVSSGSGSSSIGGSSKLSAQPTQLHPTASPVKGRLKMELIIDKRPPFQNDTRSLLVNNDLRNVRLADPVGPPEKGKGKEKHAMLDGSHQVLQDRIQNDGAIDILSTSKIKIGPPNKAHRIRTQSNEIKTKKRKRVVSSSDPADSGDAKDLSQTHHGPDKLEKKVRHVRSGSTSSLGSESSVSELVRGTFNS